MESYKTMSPLRVFIIVEQKTIQEKITLTSAAKSHLSFSYFIYFLITSSSYLKFLSYLLK